MPLRNAATGQPKIYPADAPSLPFRGIRGFATATATTVTLTLDSTIIGKEWGFTARMDGSVQLAITDLIAFSDNAGALLTINNVTNGAGPITTPIWSTYVGSGTPLLMDFTSAIMADPGCNLTLVITGATAKCSVAVTGHGLFVHAKP